MLVGFKYNICKALSTAYPNHTFLPWKFKQVPKLFWKDRDNLQQLMTWLGEQLGYKAPEDWYQLTAARMAEMGGIRHV